MANFKSSKIQYSRLTTVTSGGTLTLTAAAKQIQIFTGTQAHTMKLPDATTTSNGAGISISVLNKSTGAITVQDNGSNVIATVAAGSSLDLLLTDHSTANGVWRLGSFSSTGGGGAGSVAPSNVNVGTRGLIAGGFLSPNVISNIDYVSINTLTNAAGFGNLVNASDGGSGCASSTRGLFNEGFTTVTVANIDYVTIATLSAATAFGNLTSARLTLGACSSETRGIFAGGDTSQGNGFPGVDTIDYVTIATAANASSFGLMSSIRTDMAGCGSTTRGVFGGGYSHPNKVLLIDYVTIATTGNSLNFGNLTGSARNRNAGCSSPTRGVWAGGSDTGGAYISTIDYVTIATLGNATAFGTLGTPRQYFAGCSSRINGLFNGGITTGNVPQSTIEYVAIATTSNGMSFGSLTSTKYVIGATSNCHGGL